MRLEAVLQDEGINFEAHRHPTTYTAQRLADVEHISGHMVAKPVIVKSSAGFAMCVLPAPAHLDLERVGQVLGDANVRLASEAEMGSLFPDCELGAEPPVGRLFGLRTIVDGSLLQQETLLMQAGTHHDAVVIQRDDFRRLADPIVSDIAVC